MSRITFSLAALATMVFALGLSGCNGESQSGSDAGNREAEGRMDHDHSDHEHGDHDHGTHDHGAHDHGSSEVEATLAQLSPEDRESAQAQKLCLVSDEPLGSMGKPVKVVVGEKAVWICCDHCADPLKADPDKYLAKLNK